MNKKLKEKIFTAYEDEMNFKNNLDEVKSHLLFNEQPIVSQKKKTLAITFSSLATATAAIVLAFTITALNQHPTTELNGGTFASYESTNHPTASETTEVTEDLELM